MVDSGLVEAVVAVEAAAVEVAAAAEEVDH